MKNHIILARKYRPIFFRDIVGQDNISEIIELGLKNNELGHAFMFSGIQGTGKTTFARILARAFNCQNINKDNSIIKTSESSNDEQISKKSDFTQNNLKQENGIVDIEDINFDDDFEENNNVNLKFNKFNNESIDTGTPCVTCSSCKSFLNGENMDIVEIDAASNTGIDDIRELISSAQYTPFYQCKVFIIDEVHMLSRGAFNALLKILEEPPEHVKFIFATTEIKKVLPTILSRCIVFNLNTITNDDIFKHLKIIANLEQYNYEDEALQLIAKIASGSARDSLSILEQIKCKDKITLEAVLKTLSLFDIKSFTELIFAVLKYDTVFIANFFKDFNSDINFLIKEIMLAVYDYIKYKTVKNKINPMYVNDNILMILNDIDVNNLLILWENLTKFSQRVHLYPVLSFEIELLKYCYISEFISLNDIMSDIKNDKKVPIKQDVINTVIDNDS